MSIFSISSTHTRTVTVWVILDCKISHLYDFYSQTGRISSRLQLNTQKVKHNLWFYHKHHQQTRLNQHLTDAGMSCSSWHHFSCSNANTPTRTELSYPHQMRWRTDTHLTYCRYLNNTTLWALFYSYIINVCACVFERGKFEKDCIKALHYILKTARWAIRFRAGGQRHKPTHRKSLFCLPVCSPHTQHSN